MRALIVSLSLASLSAFALAGEPQLVKEPSTEHEFPSVRNEGARTMLLLGVGVRKKVFVKVYAMAFYVDEAEARRNFAPLVARAGGRDRAHLNASDHAQQFAIWGAFEKLAVLHFVRDVDAEKIKDAFKEGLDEELSEKSPADLRKAADDFCALFDRELKSGDDVEVRTDPDGHITVTIAGEKKDGPRSAKLARAIWSIWLGAKPISTDLRKSLVDRIELLGK